MILFGCIIIFWMLLSAARAARPVHRMIVCLLTITRASYPVSRMMMGVRYPIYSYVGFE